MTGLRLAKCIYVTFHVATNFSSMSALGIEVEFRPLLEVADEYIGDLRPIDLSDFKIRKPTLEEYNLVTNLPPTGVPIGKKRAKTQQQTTLKQCKQHQQKAYKKGDNTKTTTIYIIVCI